MNPFLIILLAVGGVLALVGIFRPFLGLFMLILIHFVQPGEMVPAINSMRLELTYGVIVLVAFVFRTLSNQGPPLLSDGILRSLAKFMAVAVLTIPGSFWVGGSINAWLGLFKIVIFVFLMKGLIAKPEQLKAMLWLQVLIMAWFAGSGLWGFNEGDAYRLHYSLGYIERAKGINSMVGGPNELAGLLVALLPYLVAVFQLAKNFFVRVLLLGLGALALTMIVLAGSRIGFISLIIIGLFYVVRSRRKVLALAIVGIIAVTTWNLMPADYQKRYLTVESYAEGGKLDDSNQLRLLIWKAGWKMFVDHPVLGVGLGQFPTAFGTKYSGVEHGAWMNPHNLLLQVACETGLIGLFFYGNFLWQIFKANKALRRFSGSGAHIVRAVATACDATLLGVVVLSCVSHTMRRPYWYFVAGLVAANTTIAEQLRRHKEIAELEADPTATAIEYEPAVSLRLEDPDVNGMSPNEAWSARIGE